MRNSEELALLSSFNPIKSILFKIVNPSLRETND